MKEEKRTIKQMNKRVLLIPWLVILLCAFCIPVFAQEYVHGYLHYTVAEDSVTITSYTGDEEVVTVPAMIGGNPVNTITGGAFAGSRAKAVYLPDTVTHVEEGAFSPGQSVVYRSASAGGDPSVDVSGSVLPQDAVGPVGISGSGGSLVTTDTEGNLILVDTEGNETVLDDSRQYTAEISSEGEVQIKNESGDPIRVEGNGNVIFQDADQNTVTVDTRTGSKTVTDTESRTGYEEVEIDENNTGAVTGEGASGGSAAGKNVSEETDKDTAGKTGSEGTDKNAAKSAGSSGRNAVYIVLVCIAAAGIFVYLNRKKKHDH